MSATVFRPDAFFISLCQAQSERLGVFSEWGFMKSPAREEYVSFLVSRCGSPERATRLIDAAILEPKMPTIAVLNRLWNDLFGTPPPAWEPELTGEDREMRKQFMHDWAAQENAGIEARRRAFREAQQKRLAPRTAPKTFLTKAPDPLELDEGLRRWNERWHEQHDPKPRS